MTFLLAHLSDPHLAPLPPPRAHELIGKRITGYFNWRRKRAAIHRPEVLERIVADLKAQATDHVAVTGDLVNLALPAEYPAALAFLDSLGTPHDVTLVPGNHDGYVRFGLRAARAHWRAFMAGDDASPDNAAATFPFLRRRGPVALIGVSTSVPSLPLFATGRVGAAQLSALPALLDRAAAEGLFRVLLIHHPPTSKRAHYLKRLVDAARLREMLGRHGAELVLHGHNHRRQTVWLDGPERKIPAIGVPSASEAPPGEHDPAGYNVIRIDGQRGAWRCELIGRGLMGERMAETERTTLLG